MQHLNGARKQVAISQPAEPLLAGPVRHSLPAPHATVYARHTYLHALRVAVVTSGYTADQPYGVKRYYVGRPTPSSTFCQDNVRCRVVLVVRLHANLRSKEGLSADILTLGWDAELEPAALQHFCLPPTRQDLQSPDIWIAMTQRLRKRG